MSRSVVWATTPVKHDFLKRRIFVASMPATGVNTSCRAINHLLMNWWRWSGCIRIVGKRWWASRHASRRYLAGSWISWTWRRGIRGVVGARKHPSRVGVVNHGNRKSRPRDFNRNYRSRGPGTLPGARNCPACKPFFLFPCVNHLPWYGKSSLSRVRAMPGTFSFYVEWYLDRRPLFK